MTDLTLTVTRLIHAAPQQVYEAWLDPAIIAKFMAGGASQTVTEARTDPREGGAFFILMQGDTAVPHQGVYKNLTPFSRIAFTWQSPYSPADSLVEILFKPAQGGTEVTLHQVRFVSEALRDGHIGGWTRILERLGAVFV